MLPHEKTLVQRLTGQPFALLGINSDGDADDVKKILAERAITWRQAIDGDTSGPLATKWNVNGWPTIYVLDAKGVIRFRDVRDAEMEKAVLALVDEAKAGK
ncbi:MAG: TlpA family protein disulfide reductase [Planctomycetes bacterium]|nr:TlpA family protein disulfide reductase [Planctomycetota bacterium]